MNESQMRRWTQNNKGKPRPESGPGMNEHLQKHWKKHTEQINAEKEYFKAELIKLFASGKNPTTITNEDLAKILKIKISKPITPANQSELRIKIGDKMKSFFTYIMKTKEVLEYQYNLYLKDKKKVNS